MSNIYIPVQCRTGNTILEEWEEPFDDGAGHTGIARWVIYEDRNKNKHKIMRWIRWSVC